MDNAEWKMNRMLRNAEGRRRRWRLLAADRGGSPTRRDRGFESLLLSNCSLEPLLRGIRRNAEGTDRVVVYLSIDLKESLTHVEDVIEQELPQIQDGLCELVGEEIKLKYRGVQGIEENGIKLSFAVFCKGKYYGWIRRLLSHDLLLMCERNEIRLAMPQIVVNERELPKAEAGT